MTCMILHNREEWPALVDHFFDNPHLFLKEDIVYSGEQGLSIDDMKDIFINAKRMALVTDNGDPIYLFGCDAGNVLCTLSAASLDGKQMTLAKHVKRFIDTEEGRRFFDGVVGATTDEDIAEYSFLHRWAKSLGFKEYASRPMADGDTERFYARF